MGPTDGAGNAGLPQDVGAVYEFAVGKMWEEGGQKGNFMYI